MKFLTYLTDSKHGSLVKVNVGKKYFAETELFKDYHKEGDGIFWLMQKAICIKAHYTTSDLLERRIYDEAETIENGDIVQINEVDLESMKIVSMKQYRAKVLGDYSDCCIFEEM